MEVKLTEQVRFGEFEFDLKAGELRQGDRKVVLREQPFQILRMLVEGRGQVVTRDEIKKKLWPNDTIVEFDHSIQSAISKLRQALGDSAGQPRYIETVARRGYRLMVKVESLSGSSSDSLRALESPPSDPGLVREVFTPAAALIGKKVSHYRVLEVVGGGGMGVVYMAEDLKLGRRVAMKFLPEELGSDPKALGRFEREARAASALDHPNICAIHEFGDHDGQPFLVMPLLEGQTLRELIVARGAPLAVDELLRLAIQIARGLEAAHEKGIIHRDIKPANVFITSRGEARILDFGLAKLTNAPLEPEAAFGAESPTPSRDLGLTRTGVALGTAPYMSPEQVRGEKLDARTDLFSFGLVLYEMATGQQAFTGHTAAVLHDAILNRTPPSARELNPELPSSLEEIVNKALQKERERRYQSAAEMLADLQNLQQESRPKRGARWWKLVGGALALLVFVGIMVRVLERQPPSLSGLPELKQTQLTDNSDENSVSSGAISPDSKYLAYADLNGMHVKLIETGETTDVPKPEELKRLQVNWDVVPTWLHDGTEFIANADLAGAPSSIWTVPALGATPHKIRESAEAYTVSRDGFWVAFQTNWGNFGYRELWAMRPDGSAAHKLYQTDDSRGFYGAEWSPDGRRLAYLVAHETADKDEMLLESRDLEGGPAATALANADAADVVGWSWMADGRMIYSKQEPGPPSASCNLWAVPVNSGTGKPTEEPKRLTNWASFCLDSPSASADSKRLVFRRWTWQANVFVADLDATGSHMTNPRRLSMIDGRNFPSAWTADSKAVIFESYRDRQWRLLKQSLDGEKVEPIVAVTDQMFNAQARLSPDGAWILYPGGYGTAVGTLAPYELLRVPINGGRSESVLKSTFYDSTQSRTAPACAKAPATLCAIAERSGDGKQIAFTSFDPLRGRGREIIRVDVDPKGRDFMWDLSSDGSRIALLQLPGTQPGHSPAGKYIRIIPFDGGPERQLVVKGWNGPQSVDWTADGKALFVSGATPTGSALLRVDLQGNAKVLWERKGGVEPWFALAPWAVPSPDGRHIAIYDWKLSANMWMMENF